MALFLSSNLNLKAQTYGYSTSSYLVEGSEGPRWLDVCGNEEGNTCSTPRSSSWRSLSWSENIAYYSLKAYDSIFK